MVVSHFFYVHPAKLKKMVPSLDSYLFEMGLNQTHQLVIKIHVVMLLFFAWGWTLKSSFHVEGSLMDVMVGRSR